MDISKFRTFTFRFNGTGSVYKVVFHSDGKSTSSHCNCPSGNSSSVCHHRKILLAGGRDRIPEKEQTALSELIALLESTDQGNVLLRRARTYTSDGSSCPQCKSTNIIQRSNVKKLFDRIAGKKPDFLCQDCEYTWDIGPS